jgi:lincosamide and streptogramin A transport system ATP-binding/permease protein
MSQIKIEDLSFSYSGGEDIFSFVNFTLDISWKLALIGRNGYGKTTLLKILTGELPYRGKIISSLNFSYFSFSIEEDEVTIDALHSLLGDNVEERVIEREASLIGLKEDRLVKKIAELSDGEKNKVQLIFYS